MSIATEEKRIKAEVNWKDKSGIEFDPKQVIPFKPFPRGSIVFGGHFGDEGKGKVVDRLAEQYKSEGYKVLSIRGQGSGNAGHTVKVDGVKYDFHYLTSAGLIADLMILGPGMLVDPIRVLKEAEILPKEQRKKIKVSERAAIITNAERVMDSWCEKQRSGSGQEEIGTTKSGVGPGAGIRGFREHITFADALYCKDAKEFRSLVLKNYLLPQEAKDVFDEEYAEKLWDAIHKLNIVDSYAEVAKCHKEGDWAVILEVSQAVGLDPLFGNSGHFTTSTPTTACGGIAYSGLTIYDFPDGTYMVLKAYSSKVGGGPFNTKFNKDEGHIAKLIDDIVGESGVTTGRKRDLGWFDATAVRYAIGLTGNTKICINCMDVIAELSSVTDYVKICYAYQNKYTGEVTYNWPYHLKDYNPLYASLLIKDKPKEQIIREYITLIELVIGRPINEYGVGPSREDHRFREDAFI